MSGSVDLQTQGMINNLFAKTRKSQSEWMEVVRESGLQKHGMIIKMVMGDFGISYGFANLIATLYRQQQTCGPASEIDLVEDQYAGAKADLRPIYEAILQSVLSFGNDIEIAPKKTYVSLRRHKQFAIVQPSTRTRLDIGLNLKNVQATDRLSGGNVFNGMCTHLVKVTSVEEIDRELIGWLKLAYDQS